MLMKKEHIARTFTFIILGLFLFSFCASVVSANAFTDKVGEITTSITTFTSAKDYFVVEKIETNYGTSIAWIIGFISLIIVGAIMLDLVMLVAPFSETVNWIIGIGLEIIMILMKTTVAIASGIFLIGSQVFGWAGAAAGGLTIVLAIAALIVIFFGGQKLQAWLIGVRTRRRGLELTKKALNSAEDIKALRRLSNEALQD